MHRFLPLLVLLAACGEPEQPPAPALDPFPLTLAMNGKPVPEGALVVDIREDGTVTPVDLRAILDERGKPFEPHPTRGLKVSPLSVVLRVERTTPWEHVDKVRALCAEAYVYRVFYAARRGVLDGALPLDAG